MKTKRQRRMKRLVTDEAPSISREEFLDKHVRGYDYAEHTHEIVRHPKIPTLQQQDLQRILERYEKRIEDLQYAQPELYRQEWRRIYLEILAYKDGLARKEMITPSDWQRLTQALQTAQNTINVLEGMPTEITLNMHLHREYLPSLKKKIEGVRRRFEALAE